MDELVKLQGFEMIIEEESIVGSPIVKCSDNDDDNTGLKYR